MMNKGIDMYTFDDQTLSDLHKDARGYRPRDEYFWARWNESNDDGKQAIWDNLIDELDAVNREDALREAEALEDFKARITDVISLGAGDRETALRWMTDRETFFHSQSVEGWVYETGNPVHRLRPGARKRAYGKLVTFEEYV